MKKRFRTVKRGVVKRELADPSSKLGKRETLKEDKLREALSGHLKPHKGLKNAFRSDDPDAIIPQHDFRQGPDFRSGSVADSGYAVWGANRPRREGDAPTARVATAVEPSAKAGDLAVSRLLRTSEQIVPIFSSRRAKKRLKNKSGVDTSAAFRWT